MEEKDLIKKLEETSLPEIEISTHKSKLKSVLIESYFQEKRRWVVFDILKIALPVGTAAVLLIGLLLTNLIFPSYSLTEVKATALQDPQIREWIERGAIIKDIEIIKNRAYVLIQPTEKMKETPVVSAMPEVEKVEKEGMEKKEEFSGALAEVNMKERKILKIEKITPPVVTLTQREQERIQEIAKNNPEIKKVIPKEAGIWKITPAPSQLNLIRKGNSVQVLPEPSAEKRASVIYRLDKNQWEGKVNLSEGEVEEVRFLGEIETDATFEK